MIKMFEEYNRDNRDKYYKEFNITTSPSIPPKLYRKFTNIEFNKIRNIIMSPLLSDKYLISKNSCGHYDVIDMYRMSPSTLHHNPVANDVGSYL